MRILTVMALLFGFTGAPKAANDGPYYSVRECLIAAGIRGGVCERNHGPAPEAPKKNEPKARLR